MSTDLSPAPTAAPWIPRPAAITEELELGLRSEEPSAAEESALREPWSTRHPVLSGLWRGTTAGLLGLVLLLALIVIVIPRIVGGVPLTVLSGSMEPVLPVGSLAVVLPVEAEDVRIGDVITYLPHPDDPTAITHRVLAITHRADGGLTFTTQGDANSAPDAPVQDFQVRAKVWYSVPWLGDVNDIVNGNARGPIVVGSALSFFLWAGSLFHRAWRDRRRARDREDQDEEPRP